MEIPNYIGKNLDEILGIESFDAAGYFYRSMAWLDYHKRTGKFSSLLYACIEGRCGIEYLLFEELIISTGANLSIEDYKKCVKEKNRFIKTIKNVAPEYERMQEFTKILISLGPSDRVFIYWNHASLMKDWGILSNYLHWFGARTLTRENPSELKVYSEKIERVLLPTWKNITSGQSAIMHPRDMKPIVKEVWEKFRTDKIDATQAKFQLNYLKPLAKLQKVPSS
jgi:hypothetical protein